MDFYKVKKQATTEKKIVCDDMILTKDLPTTAGSKMLDGYKSLFNAEVLERLYANGYSLVGKAKVGEFNIDLLGETDFEGALYSNGKLLNATAEIINSGDVATSISLDVNGSVRRASAQNNLVSIKPTYGVVSRYGTIPVACSGETVSVSAKKVDDIIAVLDVIVGHDDKDGTSLLEEDCNKAKAIKEIKKVAVISNMQKGVDETVKNNIECVVNELKANGVEVASVDSEIIELSNCAWNILMSAELCNNVSRYDGVKYGYRAKEFSGIDELYTFSRTEAFGKLLKTAILFGSETLSTENYKKVYDKALRVRRVIVEEFKEIFKDFDAVIMPACSKASYTEEFVNSDETLCYKENLYTAPASITGLPAVVASGVQLVGDAFSDYSLLALAKTLYKEGK